MIQLKDLITIYEEKMSHSLLNSEIKMVFSKRSLMLGLIYMIRLKIIALNSN